jgi:hypothetical protein
MSEIRLCVLAGSRLFPRYENQDFRENSLPLPDQWVTLPVRYDKTHPQNRHFGYARVSTYGQTLDAQLEQLRGAGCTAKIYREKVTGAHSDRRELHGCGVSFVSSPA